MNVPPSNGTLSLASHGRPGFLYCPPQKVWEEKAPDHSDPACCGTNTITSNLLCDFGQVPSPPWDSVSSSPPRKDCGLRSSLRVFLALIFKEFFHHVISTNKKVYKKSVLFFFFSKQLLLGGQMCLGGAFNGCRSKRNSQPLQIKPGQVWGALELSPVSRGWGWGRNEVTMSGSVWRSGRVQRTGPYLFLDLISSPLSASAPPPLTGCQGLCPGEIQAV